MLDPLGTLTQFFQNIANTIGNWYTDAVKSMIAFLIAPALPSEADIQSDFFKLNFGGSVGLALYLVTAVALFVLLVFLLTPRRDHSMKVSRFIGSIVGLIVYAVLFFRVYVYIDGAAKALMQFALNFITSSKSGSVDEINNLLAVSSPWGAGSVVVLGIFSFVFCLFAGGIAFGIKIIALVTLVIYPVLIILRPLGNLAVIAFNAANSFLVVAVLSPVIMIWAVALPLVVRNTIPGANATGLTATVTLVRSAGALASPILLMILFFRLSSQVFGHVDVQGNVAITSLPPLSWDEAMRDIQDKRITPIKESFGGFIGSAAGSMFEEGGIKSLINSIPDTLVSSAAVAASAQFGPVAGVVIEGVHGKVKSSIASSKEQANQANTSPPNNKEE